MSGLLVLRRSYPAAPERVFAAWTSPELLRRWWAAVQGWETASAEVDLRPGGRYRLAMRDPSSGEEHAVGGEYVTVERPARLAYTWTWEGEAEIMRGSEGTLVDVEFRPAAGGGTEVVLVHGGFGSARVRDLHEEGWTGCLDNLERRVLGGVAT